MGAPTPQGAPTYDFAKISQKLHENRFHMIKFKFSSFISEPLDIPNYEYPLVGTILHFNYSTLYWLFFKIIRILMLTYLIRVTIRLIGKHLILKLTRIHSSRMRTVR